MWYIYSVEYYLAIKWNEVLGYVLCNMDEPLQSERSQSQKTTYCKIHLYATSRTGKSIDRKWIVAA